MDNVSEKLGLYDFFNVISVGAIFILHIVFLFPKMLSSYDKMLSDGVIKFAGLFVLSYLIGLILQEIGAFVDEYWTKSKKNKIRNFLIQENIIDNNVKLAQYQKYAKDILKEKGFGFSKNLTQEQNEYIYGYIEYYIEHKNRNKKFEKMRALYGMSKSLYCCMGLVVIMCVLGFILTIIKKYEVGIIKLVLTSVYALISIIIYHFRAERCMKYRIRMMMGVYESCIEAENRERTIQNEKIN